MACQLCLSKCVFSFTMTSLNKAIFLWTTFLLISLGKRYSQKYWGNISSSVSSPDETPRRELKIRRTAEYFWRTSRCFFWWWKEVNAWYYFSKKIIFVGEIKDTKMSSFSSDFQTLIKHYFPLYFLYELLMSVRSVRQHAKFDMSS